MRTHTRSVWNRNLNDETRDSFLPTRREYLVTFYGNYVNDTQEKNWNIRPHSRHFKSIKRLDILLKEND